ncbi:S1 family peptidase [Lentzea sp. HUAS12]|uniref:S1 family peptidase n=1 Tax=Lentzea sp. HUAS12 TaxID=2951806 RepID=UPI00209F6F03|nr:S1 family peptidase [Lentzea sp. HUAS12]USX50495.1 S1 family peptidase [Lentzea sp. HUAS12]
MSYLDENARAVIRPIKRMVEDEFLARPGVIGVDIGEKVTGGRPTGRAAIVVYVCAKGPEHPRQIPVEVGGVPTDVVAESIVLHRARITRASGENPVAAERHPVLRGGIGIGPARSFRVVPPEVERAGEYVIAGTLGAFAVTLDEPGKVLGLTTFHVGCVDDSWSVGDEFVHPSRVDGGVPGADEIGVLDRAALAGAVSAAGLRMGDRPLRAEVLDIGAITGSAQAVVGSSVRKRGRTTQLTYGVVESTDATVRLDFGDGIGPRTLRDQIRVHSSERFGDHGDSGAVLVDADNRVVGLYVAGSGPTGFANPVGPVLRQLDVELLTPGVPESRRPGRGA